MLSTSDGHVHPVIDKTLRRKIQNARSNGIHKNILKKTNEKDQKVKNIDINECQLIDTNDKNIFEMIEKSDKKYLFTHDNLEELFIRYFVEKNIRLHYKMNTNIMREIVMCDKKIMLNHDHYNVLRICDKLNIPFKNQSLVSIGMQLYNEKKYIDLNKFNSCFN